MKTQAKKLTAFLLALVLVLSGLLTVSVRAEEKAPNKVEGSVDKPRELVPVMRVVFPTGTEFKDQTFKLKLTQKDSIPASDDDRYINETVTGLAEEYEVEVSNEKSGPNFAKSTSADGLLGDLFKDVVWPKVGYYVFTLEQDIPKEATAANGYVAAESKDATTGHTTKIQYDPAVYEIEVEVRAGTKSDGSTVKYPFRIGAKLTTNHEGVDASLEESGKLETVSKENLADGKLAEYVHFKNTLNVVFGEDKAALNISKSVAGEGADEDLYFPFAVKLENPEDNLIIGDTPVSYKACIKGADGERVKDGKANGVEFDADGCFNIKPDGELAFNLKAGEHLELLGGLAGLGWRAAETDSLGYSPKAKVIVGDEDKTEEASVMNPDDGTIFTPRQDKGKFNLLLKGKNSFSVTNTFKETDPPTGLFYNNLPFIVLLGLSACGIIFFLAKKTSRKEGERS